jgi:MFS family permease
VTRRNATLATLAFAILGFSIGQTAFLPAVAGLSRTLGVSTAAAGWAVTASLVSAAVLTPVLGRLADMFGRRRLFVLSLAAVFLGSVLSAIAPTLPGIIVGRVLYGAGAGLFPICFGIIREVLPTARRGQAIGALSALAALGGGIGPAFGGVLVGLGSYTTIFWFGAIVAVVPVLAAPFLDGRHFQSRAGSVDWRGTLLLAVGITAPLVAITNSVRWGWLDPRTAGFAFGGLGVLALFVQLERRTASPLLDMQIMFQRRVAVANSVSFLVGFANYSGCLLIPLLAQVPNGAGYGLGLGPAGSGLLIAPGCLTMVVMGALSGRLRHRVEARSVIVVGGIASALGLILVAASPGSLVEIAIAAALLFGGVGVAISSMANLVVDAVPSRQTGEATGVNTVARIVGAALGAQVAVTILATGTHVDGPASHRAFVTALLVSAALALLWSAVALGIRERVVIDKNYADD